MSSNVDVAFEAVYGFKSYQVGLCFIAAVIGSILGIFAGGQFSDWVADYFTRRNGGVRDPEVSAVYPPNLENKRRLTCSSRCACQP